MREPAKRLCAIAMAVMSWCAMAAPVASGLPAPASFDSGLRASPDARQAVQWILASGDHAGLPFAVVDKRMAQLYVFTPEGRIVGAAPALLGEAPGDHTVPGVGDKPPSQVRPEERTTPAGRFVSEPGRNLNGEHVVWVDYDSGFAIHRLRPGPGHDRRLERLVSPGPEDNRASLGCVVVSPSFYEEVVMPSLGRQRAMVYVLPETRPVSSLFGDTRVVMHQPADRGLR